MRDSLRATAERLAENRDDVSLQGVLNHLTRRHSTASLDYIVQDRIEGRLPWSRTMLDHRSGRFWETRMERVA